MFLMQRALSAPKPLALNIVSSPALLFCSQRKQCPIQSNTALKSHYKITWPSNCIHTKNTTWVYSLICIFFINQMHSLSLVLLSIYRQWKATVSFTQIVELGSTDGKANRAFLCSCSHCHCP